MDQFHFKLRSARYLLGVIMLCSTVLVGVLYELNRASPVGAAASALITVRQSPTTPVVVTALTQTLCTDFESGTLPAYMTAMTNTNGAANGRVQVTGAFPHGGAFAVDMDTDCGGCGGLTTQAVEMSVDLAGVAEAALDFWVWDHNDESHAEDGVFISDNGGTNYTRIYDYSSLPNAYSNVTIDLVAAAAGAGMSLVDGFLIKFQGYDNFSIPTDGYSLDDICVCVPPVAATNVVLNQAGDDLQVAWSGSGTAEYEVWYGINAPYFAPGSDCSNPDPYQCDRVTGTNHVIPAAAHSEFNLDVVVLALNQCGQRAPVATADRQGRFTYLLTGTLPANLSIAGPNITSFTLTEANRTLSHSLTYSNTSRLFTAVDAVISETIPAGAVFSPQHSSTGWQQVGSSATYTIGLGTLAPGASGIVTFGVTFNSTFPRAAALSAAIRDQGSPGTDPYPPDDTFAASFALDATPDSDGDGLPDWAETNNGVWAGPFSTGTDPSVADTDLDGIDDGDEVRGTAAGLDLPGMGTSPLQQNILLEYDWFDDGLECAAHSHRPTAAAVNEVSTSFANAPTTNPDGSTGIVLIHDYGQGGLFTGGNLIADADGVIAGGVNGSEFLAHKAANFATNRHGYFHYVLLPHRYNTSSSSSGQAELPGDDLNVSLYCANSDHNVAHTIMHELGHNLWLRHGGNENCNYKPNYNSVMNYRYQFPGVDNNCTPPGNGVLDYSTGSRITLDETNLDENDGTCGAPNAWDWNGNSMIESSVIFNINSYGSEVTECGSTLGTLGDYNDWVNIYFGGLSDGDGALPFPQEIITEDPLPPWVIEQARRERE